LRDGIEGSIPLLFYHGVSVSITWRADKAQIYFVIAAAIPKWHDVVDVENNPGSASEFRSAICLNVDPVIA
jgi:hypothetical protein